MTQEGPDRYARAERIIVLAATYGNGDAPASAKGFLDSLATLGHAPDAALAVLGCGDRSFSAYCAYAKAVAAAAEAKDWPELIPLDTVDRQSPQDFARWGRALGEAMGIELELSHQPVLSVTETLTLVSRRDYGAAVQAPSAILRFALPRATIWQQMTGAGFTRFNAGDLIGILPDGSPIPRLYSLASARRDGFIEIVVKKHPGGLASGQLTALEPGDRVTAFLRHNPGFRPDRGRAPLILIGAGTGVGPLAGFVRGNAQRRSIHLFFGMRHPDSDFYYGEEMPTWREEGRLTRLVTAVSRRARPHYVQDAVRGDAAQVAQLIHDGARVMVCGGRDMADAAPDHQAAIFAARAAKGRDVISLGFRAIGSAAFGIGPAASLGAFAPLRPADDGGVVQGHLILDADHAPARRMEAKAQLGFLAADQRRIEAADLGEGCGAIQRIAADGAHFA